MSEAPMPASEALQAVSTWIDSFAAALRDGDADAATAHFAPDCYWRDLIAFTWNIATFEGRDAIAAMLADTLERVRPRAWAVDGEAMAKDGVVEAWLSFETEVGRGKAHLRLKDGRCWTFFTALRELTGHEERRGETRETGVTHGAIRGRRNWQDLRREDEASLGITRQPFCLIVGGGQGGIGLAARLKRLGVPALVIDRHPRPGDAWRQRYDSLCLHDPVWYDHLPYLPFPEHWPIYTPKDKMGDWLESYTRLMELNYWPETACLRAAYDDMRGEWSVEVDRAGAPVTLRPRHLILATGMSGMPNVPDFPGGAAFRGVQHHSSQHRSGREFAGKACVVIGSNNSAHDIAADLWEHGAEVTMVQRSPTLVIRSETLARLGRTLYSEAAVKAGIDADMADLITASIPYRLLPQFVRPTIDRMREEDAGFYGQLAASGFMLTFGEDDSGISPMYLRRGSGYYIDVGASQLVIDGSIRLKAGADVERLFEDGVRMTDGSELKADLIVHATGYGPMDDWAAQLISPQVARKVGRCWGLGSATAKDPGPWEGELRNMWKPTQQEALWFHGGNLAQSRHYSRYLALQLKARFEGIPTPVYGLGPPHHAG